MNELNIKNIIYSNDDGSLVKIKLKDYKPKVVSLGRQFILNGCKEITRANLSLRKINYSSDEEKGSCISTQYDSDDDSGSVISKCSDSSSESRSSISSRLKAEIPSMTCTKESILSYANKLMHKSKIINF